jgi:spore coat protein CotH
MASPISRSSYVTLYINNIFYGLYYIIEDVDNEFLSSRFGTKKGALYKCNGNMGYFGPDPAAYHSQYQPRTVKKLIFFLIGQDAANESYSDLIQFIFTLHNATDNVFEYEIKKIFDVDLFLRTYIMEVATVSYCNYITN